MIALRRAENWPVLLSDFVEQHRHTPFAWHEWDCCSMAAAWVQQCTGIDLFARYAGQYVSTMPSALRLLQRANGLQPLVDAALGDSIAPAFARRGDIVMVELDGRESLAICLGQVAAGPGIRGMAFVSPAEWMCAWNI